MTIHRRYDIYFFTATILEWKPILHDDNYKKIVIESLRFLVENKRIYLCGFCIMSNHIHLLWQMQHPHELKDVQRDFLKYTAQIILKNLRNTDTQLMETLRVDAKDRKYQVWERNALSVPIRSEAVLKQKLDYIHNNPVKAGLCSLAHHYKFSSAKYYETGSDDWDFLTHYIFD